MPIISYKRQLLVNLAISNYMRSKWARDIVKGHDTGFDDHKQMRGLGKGSERWDPEFCLNDTNKGKSKRFLH
jgi:hypothetical protein